MEKILLIDQDHHIQILLEDILKDTFPNLTFHTQVILNKEVHISNEFDADIILLNFHAPKIDGPEVCRQLKQDKRTAATPLICLTRRDEDGIKRDEAFEAGVDAFLYLPFDKIELISQLRLILKIKSANKEPHGKIKEKEERYRRIFENIQDVYYEASLDGILLEVSPSIELISGGQYHRIDLIGNPIHRFYANPEDRKTILEHLFQNGRVNDYELPICNKDGTIIPCAVTAKVCYDEMGAAEKVIGSLHDITRRKQAEERLKESEFRYKLVFENSGTANSIFDTGCHLILQNEKSTEFLGLGQPVTTGMTPIDLFGQSAGTVVTERMKRVIETGISEEFETCFELVQGKSWFRSLYQPLKDGNKQIRGVQIVSHDITAQKATELALAESEARFRTLSESSLAGIYMAYNNQIQYVNPALADTFGYTPEELIGADPLIVIHHEDQNRVTENMRQRINNGQTTSLKYEYRGLKKNGDTIYILAMGGMAVINNHRVFIGNILDITERKQAEEQLKASQKQIEEILESITDGFVAFDAQMNYTYINKRGAELFNCKPEDLIGKNYWTEFPDAKGTPFAENYVRAMQTRTTIVFEDYYEPWDRWFENRIYPTREGITIYYSETTDRKRIERALNESNKLNTTLLRTIPFGMDIVDEDGNILFISENFEKLFGKESIGKKCWELYRDNKSQCGNCPLHEGITVGKTSLIETFGILGGKTFQVSHTGLIYKGKKAMLEIFQDITDKKEVEKKITLLAQSLESITECVTITDLNDNIIYVNQSFTRTFQYTREEILGQHINILRIPGEKHEKARILLPAFEIGWRGEIMNVRKDGVVFPILLSTSVINDETDTPIAMIGVAIDITEMIKSREELVSAKEKAEEINRLKSAFLGNMSHEIRTPMNAIIGFSELMTEATEDEKNSYAEVIHKSSIQLLSLIDDVILLSRLQSEKIPLQVKEFYPAEIIHDLYRMFDHPDMNNGLKIGVTVPDRLKDLAIENDPNKVKQILINLISNAVKYTPEGIISIGFELQATEVEFYVRDSGIGIPENEFEKIFETFYRGEKAMSAAIRGTGLGLNIAKELVNLTGGNIRVESEVNKGSCFYYSIPVKEHYHSHPVHFKIPAIPRSLKDLKILVADDEPFNSKYLDAILKGVVKRIDHAINGKLAVEMAENNVYDLILMDLKMPVMDGFEATKIIKERFPFIPVIAQTAYSLPEEKQAALAAGFDEFLTKPLKKEVVIQTIGKYANFKKS